MRRRPDVSQILRRYYWISSVVAVIFINLSVISKVDAQATIQSLNTPPTINVDREWIVQEDDPIGTIVTRVRAQDQEQDVLTFGLELPGPYENGYGIVNQVPFTIEPSGSVKINESLAGKGGQKFFLYVTVDDGQISAKNQVLVAIMGKNATRNSNTYRQPTFTPNTDTIKKLIPNGFYTQPGGVPRPANPNIFNRHQTKTYPEPLRPTANNETSQTSEAPSSASPNEAEKSRKVPTSTVTPTPPTPTAQFPPLVSVILTVCGIFLIAGLIALLMFRNYLCTISKQLKHKNKIEKAKKSNQSQISNISSNITEDSRNSILMHQWAGPTAPGNRYFSGWGDNQHAQVTSQLSNGTNMSQASVDNKDRWEFPRHKLKVFNILGEGAFGQVWRCEAQDIDGIEGVTTVAVKTLKDNANESERNDLLSELAVMKTLDPHVNVVRLLGCCTEKEPIFVILEYVTQGKLQTYLRNSRTEKHYGNYNNTNGKSKTLTSGDLTSFMYQVARGMDYLTSRGIIHRDLAARNILITDDQTCKVADFGFARDIITSKVYERKSEGRLPIRWMAIESLYDNIFSVKSDIWSFGVLMWEICTLGSTPYPGISASDVMRKVRDGHRLEKPEHCRRELYNIMYYCWAKDPNERPTFGELVTMLDKLLLTEMDYIELEQFPEHNYYNMLNQSGEKL
ncbi:tyrosine kinase receptor Cad96Ca [Culicoides brevitarsis]|uniref:tyrosine kinase receptor Cad96Ca n=1 Tax=Culicoides brevitarsis TaxID=469753 RepID=UPI00307C2414